MEGEEQARDIIPESAEVIGDNIYVAEIVNEFAFPDLSKAYNDGLEEECPRCGGILTCCVKEGWYCNECQLLWEWRTYYPCPVCGNEMILPWGTCSGCGSVWAAKDLVDALRFNEEGGESYAKPEAVQVSSQDQEVQEDDEDVCSPDWE